MFGRKNMTKTCLDIRNIPKWAGRESNPYGREAQRLLRPSRLPVPPPALSKEELM